MAERSYNGRELVQNPNMIGVGSTTSENAWVGDAAYLWRMAQTSGGNNVLTQFTNEDGFDCLKMQVDSVARLGGNISQIYIGNLAEYAAGSVNAANLAIYGIPYKPTYTYEYTVTYKLTELTADTGYASFFIAATAYDTNGVRNQSTPSNLVSRTTTTDGWVTETYILPKDNEARMAYLGLRIGFAAIGDPTTNGRGTVFIREISFKEILPARTTATSRTTASNRVAVRDMGTALRFDGVDDEVEIPTALVGTSFNTENPHTYAAWVNVQAIQGLNNRGIIDKYASTTGVTKLGSRLTITTGGYVNFMYGDGVGQHDTGVSTANLVPLRTWVHVAGVYTGTQIMVCINGVCRTATATYPSSNLNNTIEIGGTHHSNGKLNALIDEPRIWNRVLTTTEISNLYLYNIVPQDGLVAEYLFDEGSGTTAIDTSGNENDGTITGATYTTDTPLQPRTSV